MEKIIIVGAGGFRKDIEFVIDLINEKEPTWEILGYIDDGIPEGTEVGDYKILGNIDALRNFEENTAIVIAVGSSKTRKKIYEKICAVGKFQFPNLVSPDVKMARTVKIGKGCIILPGCILSGDAYLEDFVILNLSSTIGHDAKLKSFVMVYPGVNISGNVTIQETTEIGTGSQVIQGLTICENCIIGAGAVVVRDITEEGTYVGLPARKINKEL